MSLLASPIPVDDVPGQYAARGLERVSDARLVAEVGAVLGTPRRNPADSFVLHAPLELAARAALLPYVRPVQRERARLRLVALAAGFEAFGPPVDTAENGSFDSVATAASRLRAALARGELDDIDVAARWLGRRARPGELRRLLGDEILPRLAAAAHAPIFLYHLPRVGPRGELGGELLRGLARELGRAPDWRLRWIDEPLRETSPSAGALFEALRSTPLLGNPGSIFIYPVMSSVDGSGVAARLLGAVVAGLDVDDAAPVILRAAALSMLQEPPEHAPYGWSHCLTMPQAVLGIADTCADPTRAVAVAATYVIGFRAALATNPLVDRYAPEPPGVTWRDALGAEPGVAAAAAWHAPEVDGAALVTELATRASVHEDANLVKYTLACLDAAARDPAARRLYLAAAASLVAWWARFRGSSGT